MIAVLSKHH